MADATANEPAPISADLFAARPTHVLGREPAPRGRRRGRHRVCAVRRVPRRWVLHVDVSRALFDVMVC